MRGTHFLRLACKAPLPSARATAIRARPHAMHAPTPAILPQRASPYISISRHSYAISTIRRRSKLRTLLRCTRDVREAKEARDAVVVSFAPRYITISRDYLIKYDDTDYDMIGVRLRYFGPKCHVIAARLLMARRATRV